MEPEIHIAGLLVQTRPSRGREVGDTLAAMPEVEVHAVDAAGKVVVVSECASRAEVVALIDRIRELPGVLNVALVYQHAESAQAMGEEISHADPPRFH